MNADGLPPPILHPSIPLRFTDVLEELRRIAGMALADDQIEAEAVAAACRRAESLLLVLRRQFLQEVVIGEDPPAARVAV
jgi:hypothetical protein